MILRHAPVDKAILLLVLHTAVLGTEGACTCFLADLIVCCSAGKVDSCNNLLIVLEDQGSLRVMEVSGVIFCSGQCRNMAKDI